MQSKFLSIFLLIAFSSVFIGCKCRARLGESTGRICLRQAARAHSHKLLGTLYGNSNCLTTTLASVLILYNSWCNIAQDTLYHFVIAVRRQQCKFKNVHKLLGNDLWIFLLLFFFRTRGMISPVTGIYVKQYTCCSFVE